MSLHQKQTSLLKLFSKEPECKYETVFNIQLSKYVEDDLKFIQKVENVIGKKLHKQSQLSGITIEIGPLASFQTSWSTNAMSILTQSGLTEIEKIEKSRRYLAANDYDGNYDQMTERIYPNGFYFENTKVNTEKVQTIPKEEIREYGEQLGLTFDDHDIDFYTNVVFKDRDPTEVELFDLAQSNSEHSRHWYFNAKLIDKETGEPLPETLFDLVKKPHKQQKTIFFL